jgi:hypothetical protein
MAGNLPVPNGLEVKLTWSFNGQPFALNILHALNQGSTTITQAITNALDVAIKNAVTSTGHGGQLNTGVALASVELRSMNANSDPWFIGTAAPVAGTSAENPLPAATALVITLRTGLRGRSYNGRLYLFGFSELANDAAGGATALAAANGAAFVNAISTALQAPGLGAQMSVLSRFTTPPGTQVAVERNPPILTPVTAAIAKDQRWDVQRRRAIPGV